MIKVEFNLPNYETKRNLNKAAGIDTWDFVKKTFLANLKSDIDK